jgi:hypothetical protein
MFELLNPRLWAAVAAVALLTGTHTLAYKAGRAAVRGAWDADIALRSASALAASEKRRNDEKALSAETLKVANDLALQNTRRAAAERAAADSLRSFKATLYAPVGADPAAAGRVDGTGGLERELLGQCADALANLASTADRLEGKVVGLQGYVAGVCLAGGR